VCHCCKVPCLDLGARHERYKEALNKLRQRIRRVCPNRSLKDVLLLHDNARTHANLLIREAIEKMWCRVLTHPAHGPDLAPSGCHLFGPVKNALRGHHFADDKELKQSFHDVPRSRGRKVYNSGVERLTQCWQNAMKITGTVWKNNLLIAKGVWTIHVNFIFIVITFSEKEWTHYFHTASRRTWERYRFRW
jgi:hypothetical protein